MGHHLAGDLAESRIQQAALQIDHQQLRIGIRHQATLFRLGGPVPVFVVPASLPLPRPAKNRVFPLAPDRT
jgi:hypothetical protein